MRDLDRGPLDRYELTWRSGYVETVEAHQCLLLPGLFGFGDEEGPRRVVFHGEVNGRWKLILDADYADILSVRLLARDDADVSEAA